MPPSEGEGDEDFDDRFDSRVGSVPPSELGGKVSIVEVVADSSTRPPGFCYRLVGLYGGGATGSTVSVGFDPGDGFDGGKNF